MILKEDSTEQKLRGAYYTPTRLAQYIVHLVKDHYVGGGILEPSCGDGVFIDAIEAECDLSKIDARTYPSPCEMLFPSWRILPTQASGTVYLIYGYQCAM